jgi:hypothetical protein
MPIVIEEPESAVLTSGATSEITKEPDVESGLWIRSCPMCAAVLVKSNLHISVACRCGWQWQA